MMMSGRHGINDASHFDQETEPHVRSSSDFIICMIRVQRALRMIGFRLGSGHCQV